MCSASALDKADVLASQYRSIPTALLFSRLPMGGVRPHPGLSRLGLTHRHPKKRLYHPFATELNEQRECRWCQAIFRSCPVRVDVLLS